MNATEARKASEENVQGKLTAALAQFETKVAEAVKEGKLFLDITVPSEVFPFFSQELNRAGYQYKDTSLLPGIGVSTYLRVSW